jgi:hypothetical protein
MIGWNLYNAGNDAHYSLQALVAMLINRSVGGPTGGSKPGETPLFVEMGD